jgi:MFS family permease
VVASSSLAKGAAHAIRRIWTLAIATGVSVLATAYAPNVLVAFAAIAIAGFSSIWLIALANTLVMLRSHAEMQGRVMGIWTIALPGLIPFTGMLTAWVAQTVNGRAGFALAGVAMLLAALGTAGTMAVRSTGADIESDGLSDPIATVAAEPTG